MIYSAVISEVWFEYVRSRGPGGQHVNKTNSAAILRWHVSSSQAFSDEQKQIIESKLANYISSEGFLILRSDQFRNQEQNRSACVDKLQSILKVALFKPKKRIKTRPTKSSIKKRLNSKKNISEKKNLRKRII